MLDALLSDNTQWFGDCLLENASLFCIDVYLYAVKSSSDMIDTNRKKKIFCRFHIFMQNQFSFVCLVTDLCQTEIS